MVFSEKRTVIEGLKRLARDGVRRGFPVFHQHSGKPLREINDGGTGIARPFRRLVEAIVAHLRLVELQCVAEVVIQDLVTRGQDRIENMILACGAEVMDSRRFLLPFDDPFCGSRRGLEQHDSRPPNAFQRAIPRIDGLIRKIRLEVCDVLVIDDKRAHLVLTRSRAFWCR